MKKVLFIIFVFVSLLLNAQDYTVKFLGIPVDGTKKEMISKLKKKGFKYDRNNDYLEGRFNNHDVLVFINTYKDKVWRISVADKYVLSDETNIRIRYNQLIDQFEKNNKYTSLLYENNKIEEDEDISYEIKIKHKRYQANFTQGYSTDEMIDLYNDEDYFNKWLSNYYTKHKLDSLYSVSENEEDFEDRIRNSFVISHSALNFVFENNNTVWFMIGEQNNSYYIVMYYENNKNEPKGEDL